MTTPYRNEQDVLRSRLAARLEELAAAQARVRDLGDAQLTAVRIAGEVEALRRELALVERRALPVLEGMRIAKPCTASWDEMVGDGRVRHCTHCDKDVYNIAEMTREEAERLVRERAGSMCVRLYQRRDGTLLTSDCPVGVTRARRRTVAMAALGGGLIAATALLAYEALHEEEPAMVMGAISGPAR